jgi:DNA-binding beta-propeller fold protein YncE
MKFRLTLIASALALAACGAAAQTSPISSITKLWTFAHGAGLSGSGRSSEIAAWDPASRSMFVVGGSGIDVLDLAGNLRQSFDTSAFGTVNSISIANGVAAVAFSNGSTPVEFVQPGTLRFFDTQTFASSGGAAAVRGFVSVGAVPDMVTWTADGTRLLVANEGERQAANLNLRNPAGSISLINFNAAAPSTSLVTTLGFTGFDGQEDALRAAGVRIPVGMRLSEAVEPEYIALSRDGRFAHVTLQEANSIAIVDLGANPRVTQIVPLGLKDFSRPGNFIDPSDQDFISGSAGPTRLDLRSVPVKGLYMPDTIASYAVGNRSFYVMANEGDAFVDDADIIRFGNAAVTLDGTAFPNAAALKANSSLGRMNIVRTGANGAGGITNMTEIVTLGGRSFSIRDDQGNLVFDSGSKLEEEAIRLGLYDDSRSDDKGVEPEGVVIFNVAGRSIAAIGMERTLRSAFALYDITDPANATFLQMIDTGSAAESRLEGLLAFEADGKIYLALSNELPSNLTSLYQITAVPEPGTWALLAGGIAGLLLVRRRRQ